MWMKLTNLLLIVNKNYPLRRDVYFGGTESLSLRSLVKELHRDHPGASRMKAVARSYFWYPGLDKDSEDCARSCNSC